VRHPEEISSNVILWKPAHGKASAGRTAVNFIDTLLKGTGLALTTEIDDVMRDRNIWRDLVSKVRSAESKYVTTKSSRYFRRYGK